MGSAHHPENPGIYEQMYFADIELEGNTKAEIEQILASRKLSELNIKATKERLLHMEQEKQHRALLTESLAGICEEYLRWIAVRRRQKIEDYNPVHTWEDTIDEYEYELY